MVLWIAAVILSTYRDRVNIFFDTLSKTAIVPGITGRVMTAVLTWYGRHFLNFKFIYKEVFYFKRTFNLLCKTILVIHMTMLAWFLKMLLHKCTHQKHSLNTVVQIHKSLFHKFTNQCIKYFLKTLLHKCTKKCFHKSVIHKFTNQSFLLFSKNCFTNSRTNFVTNNQKLVHEFTNQCCYKVSKCC